MQQMFYITQHDPLDMVYICQPTGLASWGRMVLCECRCVAMREKDICIHTTLAHTISNHYAVASEKGLLPADT
jgi:hypothetical protein